MKKLMINSAGVLLIVFSLVFLVTLSACSSGYNSPAATTATTPAVASSTNSVNISNFAFAPVTLTVKVGTTVTWTNNDSVGHTVTSDSGVFDSGTLATGKTFSYTFSTAGTFPYHCSIHTSMKASVIVQ